MKMTNALKAQCAQVVETVSIAKGRVRLIPFDRDMWIQCVYFSIQRTLPQGVRQITLEHLRRDLFDAVYALNHQPATVDAFEPWIAHTIQMLAETYTLSVGQSQRLINTLLMYYYCYYYAEIDHMWNEEHRFIAQYSPFLHIPITSHALLKLKVVYDCPDLHINRAQTSATIRVGDAFVSWSRLDDFSIYVKLQHFIRDIQDNHLQVFTTALHFALAELAVTP
ncbi:MAG: hypothetical protein HGA19_11985 [Oscillochloris sp.]|nr:hypothetical protein [Oscillochloris sp.]